MKWIARYASRIVSLVVLLSATFAVAAANDERPYVQVSPRDARYFELDNGEPFIPIGLNMASVWSESGEDEALRRMEDWMKSLSENGGNFVRVWLSSSQGLAGATIRVYDPWKDMWSSAQPNGDTIALPPFKRSIVIRITR